MKMIRKNWFMLALLVVAVSTVAFRTPLVEIGLVAGGLHLPNLVVCMIFFFSGLQLDFTQIRQGLTDYRATLTALVLILVLAPMLGALSTLLPLQLGLSLGLLLVSVMPSTLSSGVVMTGAAGGNMAHALLVTVLTNILAVFTIPLSLGLLLSLVGEGQEIVFERLPIMLKIVELVIVPLLLGCIVRVWQERRVLPLLPRLSFFNQLGVLFMVWMGTCRGRGAILADLHLLPLILLLVVAFHLILVLLGWMLTSLGKIGKGRRESVILMGAQKTLPLCLILQMSLFPDSGMTLTFCLLHHVVHLFMDSLLVNVLWAWERASNS